MSATYQLLHLLICEREQLLSAADRDERDPLADLPGTAGAGSLCQSRAVELWTGWQPRGAPAERDRLHREALAELARTHLYATLAPLLADVLAVHLDLADSCCDGEMPDLERHCRTLAALQVHLPAIDAALSVRPAPPASSAETAPPAPGPRLVSPRWRRVLDALADGRPRQGKAVARRVGVKYGTIRGVLPGMVRAGLLAHGPDGYCLA